MSTLEKMHLSKTVVVAVSFLMIAMFSAVSAIPRPGVIRERHIIHAPIKFKTIHHYNIKKVPIFIKKHLHYYKPQEEIHLHSKPTVDETHDNQIYQEDNGKHQGHQWYRNQYNHPQVSLPHGQEEDYEEPEQSQEENEEFEDYEYE